MKKILIGSIVGGLIIYLWQFLSFAMIDFHQPVEAYTDKQETIMNFLNTQGLKEGGYKLPTLPRNTTMEQWNEEMKKAEGKPWASIQYHSSFHMDMTMNMIRGIIVNILMIALFCWLVGRMTLPGFGTIVGSAIVVGLIVFLNVPYTGYIWYKSFDIWAYLLDAVVGWGLTGLWLAWWLRREQTEVRKARSRVREEAIA